MTDSAPARPRRTRSSCCARCCASGASRSAASSCTARARSAASSTSTSARRRSPSASMQALDARRRGRRDLPRARPRARARRAGRRRSWPRCTARSKAAAAAAAARCTSSTRARASTAATPSSAAACRSRSASRSPTSCSGRPRVTACFFGEGAVAEGEFHESLNLAALWQLPVLFCCENNLYAMGTALERSRVGDRPRARRPRATRCRPWPVDGMDVARGRATRPRRARRRGPRAAAARTSSSCRTYRFRAHSMFDPELYRDKAEVEAWKQRDPIVTLRSPTGSRRGTARRRRRSRRSRRRSRPRSTPRSRSPRPGRSEPVEDLTRVRLHEARGMTATATAMTHDVPRSAARGDPRGAARATSASS